jgi:colanic acid biosynthesis glycosyl transferase WcaI
VIPSKIFEAMAMERPIIMGVKGESAEIVETAAAGIAMEPGDPHALLACVTQLKDDSGLYRRLAECGRSFVLREFSRDTFAADYEELLCRVSGVACASADQECATVEVNG